MATLEQSKSEDASSVPDFVLSELPQNFSAKLVADWSVDSNLGTGSKLARLIARADDYLNGLNIPNGLDKQQVRREAGRFLNYLRQTMGNDEVWQGVEPSQREHLSKEADRLWNEMGNEANREWNETNQDKPVAMETPKSESEIRAEALAASVNKAVLALSETAQLVESRAEILRGSVPNFKDSNTNESLGIIKRMLERALPNFIDFQNELGSIDKNNEAFKKSLKKYRGLIINKILPIADGLRSSKTFAAQGADKAVAAQCAALYDDFVTKLDAAGVQKIKVAAGEPINWETMEASEVVKRDDPKYGAKYSGSETVADVERDGFVFANNLEPDKGLALVRTTQVIGYK